MHTYYVANNLVRLWCRAALSTYILKQVIKKYISLIAQWYNNVIFITYLNDR